MLATRRLLRILAAGVAVTPETTVHAARRPLHGWPAGATTPRAAGRPLRSWLAGAAIAFGGTLTAHAGDITVSAAASLAPAFAAIGHAFAKAQPTVRVSFNFAASGALLAQIRQGAPVDVFASADAATLDRAAAAGLLAPASRIDFARNALVLVLPARALSVPLPTTLADLDAPGYARIALGTPASVPAGRYAIDALTQAGLAERLQARLIYGESVRQVLDYVERAEVDAGFVYRTDAYRTDAPSAAHNARVRIAFTVPTATPVVYPIARVAASRNPAEAQAFIDFVRGAEGQRLLARFGFGAP